MDTRPYPGSYGQIYPLNEDQLAVCVASLRLARQMRQECPELLVDQDASDAVFFAFASKNFQTVAKWVKPRHRRHLTESHNQELQKCESRRLEKPSNPVTRCTN